MANNQKYIPALGYDWLTGLYDLTIRLTMPEQRFRNRLVQELNVQPGEKILEFGFGTGQNLLLVGKGNVAAQYSGLDIDPKVYKIARDKLKKHRINVALDLYEGEIFPYPSRTFDTVFSALVFHQLDRETKDHSLKEIYRVLRPGGRLVIADWGKAKSLRMRIAFYLVQLLDGFATTADNVKGLLPSFMSEAGFSKVQETGFINTTIGSFCYYQGIKE